MSLAADILALRDLVAEGHLPWHEAALELRAERPWLTLRTLTLSGASARLQAADPGFQRRLQLARLRQK